jgi:ATP-dependent Lhr-like helicase
LHPSSSEGGKASSSFGLLPEKVQRWVWERNWNELRDVQERAIPPILGGREDVILAAATAGGKTEAAFLPIVSRLIGAESPGVGCLYVSPLKALINDQYLRLDALCEGMEIPVHRWHGDVSSDRKHKVLKDPSGVLLITPESIEALMVLHGTTIPMIFSGLNYIVVDELHSFIGSERGRQLQSLLHRIEHAVGARIPRIGLSATLGDMALAAEFLRPHGGAEVCIIVDAGGEGQELRIQSLGYQISAAPEPPRRSGKDTEGSRPKADDSKDAQEEEALEAVCGHIFRHLRGQDNLIFANSRRMVEYISDQLRHMSERAGVPNEFVPHHGSLSKAIREDVEERLKDRVLPLSAVCTSTLEMGIDIGSVASVAQVGPPPSVASLRQRLGRSGRRGEPAVLRTYSLEDEIAPQSAVPDLLRCETVETIAMIELLLERWCEPPETGAFHYSTLIQQVLSIIAQQGGVRALDAWRRLCGTGPFANVDQPRFSKLLQSLGHDELISQMADGTLVLGTVGERIVNDYKFYAAFTTPEEYRIVHAGQVLGQIPVSYPLQEEMCIIFAGRRWKIISISEEERVIEVVPAAGGVAPRFSGYGAAVHDRVRHKMLEVYQSSTVPAYLAVSARELLREGRAEFSRMGLAHRRIVACEGTVTLFPWAGDRVMSTLVLTLVAQKFDAYRVGVAIEIDKRTSREVEDLLTAILRVGAIDTVSLARAAKDLVREKYDYFVPDDLAAEDSAMRRLDGKGTLEAIRGIIGS